MMELTFSGEVFEWRGPAPHYFVAIPEEISATIKDMSAGLSYGWGAIPAEVTLGESTWTTSIFPKNGVYIVPLRKILRAAEGVEVGDLVSIALRL